MKESEPKRRAKRDPEARRQAIEHAAAELLLKEGSQRLTHRRVAEKAQVPLGSTTQYFSSIDELRRAGYRVLAEEIDKDYRETIERIKQSKGDIRVVASCIAQYASNRDEVRTDIVLYSAAVRDPEVRRYATCGLERFVQALKVYLPDSQAKAIAVFMDGIFSEVGIFGREFSEEFIYEALCALTQISPSVR